MAIIKKSKAEIENMRVAGRLVHEILESCRAMCKPGVTTRQIDEHAGALIAQRGAKGLFKHYPGPTPFPCNLCISVNEVVVHGIANDQAIQEGDIIGIDCGVAVDGWCGDSARTFMVGDVRRDVRKLCEVTEHVLALAVQHIRPGRKWSQIARIMQNYAESHGFGVVRDFVGHGIGQSMHEDPKLPNFVNRDLIRNDILLGEGMVFAVEPMCNLGVAEVMTLDDGWTVVTADRKPSAHYEHTIAITANGADVLTDGR